VPIPLVVVLVVELLVVLLVVELLVVVGPAVLVVELLVEVDALVVVGKVGLVVEALGVVVADPVHLEVCPHRQGLDGKECAELESLRETELASAVTTPQNAKKRIIVVKGARARRTVRQPRRGFGLGR
jgi:hypothetical protein